MNKATHTCDICGKGICQAGHDDDNRPYWLHVDGNLTYRACYEDDDLAVAVPARSGSLTDAWRASARPA